MDAQLPEEMRYNQVTDRASQGLSQFSYLLLTSKM